MISEVLHSKYIAKVILEIPQPEWRNPPQNSKNTWWVDSDVLVHMNVELKVHQCLVINPSPCLIFLDEMPANQLFQYLINLYGANIPLPDGGLVFIDQGTGELVETNWDIGETEEWKEILDQLVESGIALHTFSATDAAIECRSVAEGVSLQNLNWEALPTRIESDRQMQAKHIFIDQPKFLSEGHKCLNHFAAFLTNTATLPEEHRSAISNYLSVRSRRSLQE